MRDSQIAPLLNKFRRRTNLKVFNEKIKSTETLSENIELTVCYKILFENDIKFESGVDVRKYLKQVKLPISLNLCASFDVLPSNKSSKYGNEIIVPYLKKSKKGRKKVLLPLIFFAASLIYVGNILLLFGWAASK